MPWGYPIFLDLTGKRCLAIGHGVECAQKIQGMLDARAEVVWISPQGPAELAALASAGRIEWRQRWPEDSDFEDCYLVVATGPGRERNAWIYSQAESRDILVNCLDDPPHCRFAFASTLKRGDLTVAIFTNGKSPAISVRLRQRFERELGSEYAAFLDLAGTHRDEIASRVPDFARRKDLWYRLADSSAIDLLKSGDHQAAKLVFKRLIAEAAQPMPDRGDRHEHADHH